MIHFKRLRQHAACGLLSTLCVFAMPHTVLADDNSLVQAITQSFNNLDDTLNKLFGAASGDDKYLSVYSQFISESQASETQDIADQTTWDKYNKAMIAGLNMPDKPNPSGNASFTYQDSADPNAQSSGLGALFGVASSGKQLPQTWFTDLQNFTALTQFPGIDLPYNPSSGFDVTVDVNQSASNLSFDSVISGTDQAQNFLTILINPEDLPLSIQSYIYSQYKNNSKKFDAKKDAKNLLTDSNGELKDSLQRYQSKRRRYLAIQNVAISNLQALPRLGGHGTTHDTVQAIINTDWDQASNVTVARLNLMANLMIADELSKKRELDQRILATLSVLLLQNTETMGHDIVMSEKDMKSSVNAIFGIKNSSSGSSAAPLTSQ